MSPERQIYLLDPQSIDPETIAVAFAKTSRSPQSFRQIAAELSAEKSAEFHERWVVGYGHASVAEHAVLHIAIENVSRLAVETIESSRLASYTEKSTRYQKWGASDFFLPPEVRGHALEPTYTAACRGLFEAYLQILPLVKTDVERDLPRKAGESDAAWERRIRSEYVDVCRFLLPASALANLGMTINARALEHALRKMLSHPLAEVRAVGEEIKAAALASVPTLIKYVDPRDYPGSAAAALTQALGAPAFDAQPSDTAAADWCRLLPVADELELRVLAAALYRFGSDGYAHYIDALRRADPSTRAAIAGDVFNGLGRHDIPLRELEFGTLTWDVCVDQGAYFELKRHRMMTQTPQALTAELGYAVPRRLACAGALDIYRRAMDALLPAYRQLAAWNPQVAAYCVPNGYLRRTLLGCNLRSLDHFCALRSAENAHFSMRRLALRMAEQAREALPLLGGFVRVTPGETWQDVEARHFLDA